MAVLSLPALPFARRYNWLTIIGLWTLPGAVALSYYYLNQIVTAQPLSWSYGVITTLPNWYIWAGLTPVILWAADRIRPDQSNWGAFLGKHVPIMLALLGVHALLNLLLFRATGLHDTLTAGLYQVHFTSRMHANVLTYFTVLGLFYAYDYGRKYQARARQTAELELQLAQANLRALKMQLHPHFLFNTLHSISGLVRKEENKTAVRMLGRLGGFLRLALENKGTQEVPLAQEVDFLEQYLAIEQLRFQDRLRFAFQLSPEATEAYVPNLILQPLVENSVHHGIAPHADAGLIEMRGTVENGRLILVVTDDGPGLQSASRSRGGVGLTNTRERLRTLYGSDHTIDFQNRESGGLQVTINIPFHTTPIAPTT